MAYKCPAKESSKFLCDRVAEYHVNGTVWCNTHARRVLDGDDMTVKIREYEGKVAHEIEKAMNEVSV